MSRVSLIVCLLLLSALAYFAFVVSPAEGATPRPGVAKLAPPVPCTAKLRMDVFIDEDNIMYECQCQWLKTIPLCAWQVIGGVESVAVRRFRKRHQHIRLIPVLIVRPA